MFHFISTQWVKWNYHIESLKVAIMTWATVMECLCNNLAYICPVYGYKFLFFSLGIFTFSSFFVHDLAFSMTNHRILDTRNTTGANKVEHDKISFSWLCILTWLLWACTSCFSITRNPLCWKGSTIAGISAAVQRTVHNWKIEIISLVVKLCS
jgi:hypothetical protein